MFRRTVTLTSGTQKIESPPFDIHFQLRFDNEAEPNVAVIDVFNLSQETINKFNRGQNVILNAGYEGDSGTILAGTIDEVSSFWEVGRGSGNERIMRLEVNDALGRWTSTNINKTYKAGIKASQIIRDMLNMFGLEIGALQLPNDVNYENGRTFSGTLQTALLQVVSDTGARLHISNGAIFVQPSDKGERIAFVLGADTGLIESPERIDSEEGERWRVTSLLNYRIKPNTIIKIDSINTQGFFRVVKGEHVCGDQDFDTRMEVVSA